MAKKRMTTQCVEQGNHENQEKQESCTPFVKRGLEHRHTFLSCSVLQQTVQCLKCRQPVWNWPALSTPLHLPFQFLPVQIFQTLGCSQPASTPRFSF